MLVSSARFQVAARALAGVALFASAILLSGCASMGEGMTSAFADPAKYQLYDCKQLETERKALSARQAELQGLMSKAQDGFAGPVVAEVAYRNEYLAVRGQAKNAEEAWVLNKCRETPGKAASPTPPPPVADVSGRPLKRSGSAVY
ncbi:twin-arginine translocation pathway signal [Bradyrhizobium erythrophlei]|jgi:hypothetical protein|uniref:Twin-arginine translocation pathway signal n=1 Tax=Bradyrhizobium erythrophlei TaxID=1437360 RepID=A0A1M7UKZ0_9BRAD|nr:twin-arginine translocation pathway signal [Bradyrhizobium erythrophlei]SHN83692.1 hypothetical protein SAMN05444170_5596 [Bradyrhizobium erythrophlei]